MAVNGKGKQIESKAPAASSSSKRKKPVPQELLDRRRKRKPGVLQFFDDMAEDVDYEEEDEEAEEEEDNDFDFEDERASLGTKCLHGSFPYGFKVHFHRHVPTVGVWL